MNNFGIGGAPQAFTLNSEFLPVKKRAKFTFFSYVFWAIGGCTEVLLAFFIMPKLGWRWLLGVTSTPLILFMFLCIWLPESARFHVVSNKSDLALKTLQRIDNDNKKCLPKGVLVEEVI